MDKGIRKIIIVTHGFYPEQSPRSFRATELAKEFVRQGHKVTVVAPARKGMESLTKDYSIEIIGIKDISWKVPLLKINNSYALVLNRVIKRFLSLLFEYPHIQISHTVKKTLKDQNGFDMLISVAVPYPIHWGVAAAWSRNGHSNPASIWVADCGDPYMGGENDSFRKPFYFKFVEKWMFRKTDYITVPTKESIAAYYPEFHEKIRVIPQGFRFEDVKQNEHRSNDIPFFAYAGAFIPGRRDPREFLEYLSNQNRDFRFYIYTNQRDFVSSYVKNGDHRVILRDYIPRLELLDELSSMDFVVNFENFGNTQTPSKLIDYAIIDKPVLPIKTGSLNEQAVNEFLDGNYSKRFVIDNPEQYRIEQVTRRFLDLCKQEN